MKRVDKNGWDNAISVVLLLSKGAESRRKILEVLLYGPKRCNQIAKEVKLNWRTVNWHLQVLMEGNLIKSVGFGQRRFYKLTKNGEEALEYFQSKRKKNTREDTRHSNMDKFVNNFSNRNSASVTHRR